MKHSLQLFKQDAEELKAIELEKMKWEVTTSYRTPLYIRGSKFYSKSRFQEALGRGIDEGYHQAFSLKTSKA